MKTEPILVGYSEFRYSQTQCNQIAKLLPLNDNKISLVYACIKDQWKPEEAEDVIRLIEAIKETPDYWAAVLSKSSGTIVETSI